jgi:hypothetical protein
LELSEKQLKSSNEENLRKLVHLLLTAILAWVVKEAAKGMVALGEFNLEETINMELGGE